MSRDKKSKMKELVSWWLIYFVWINKLAFLIEDKLS